MSFFQFFDKTLRFILFFKQNVAAILMEPKVKIVMTMEHVIAKTNSLEKNVRHAKEISLDINAICALMDILELTVTKVISTTQLCGEAFTSS